VETAGLEARNPQHKSAVAADPLEPDSRMH
jgi:hypothetical protein